MKVRNKIFASIIVVNAALVSGCASTPVSWKCSAESDGGDITSKCEIEGTFIMSMLRPILSVMAEAQVFTYEDWVGVDFSDYSMSLGGVNNISVPSNQIKVDVYDDTYLIATKNFAVHQTGGEFKLSNPALASSWSQSHIDVATKVSVELVATASQSGTFIVSSKENGATRASASVYYSTPNNNYFFQNEQ